MDRATEYKWVELIDKIVSSPTTDLGPEIGDPTPEEREAARTKKCPNECGYALDPLGRHLHGGGWNCHRCGAILTKNQYDAVLWGREVPREEILVRPWPWTKSRRDGAKP